jgi:hypothetical protein
MDGQISIENTAKVECTRYEWSFADDAVTEEIVFVFEDGRMFSVNGDDGFFKKIYEAIENHELVDANV